MRTHATLALAAVLLASAPSYTLQDRALAQAAAPAGHQYVVSVSGMT